MSWQMEQAVPTATRCQTVTDVCQVVVPGVGQHLRTVTYLEVTDRSALSGGHARSGDARAAGSAGAPLPWAPDVHAPVP